MRDVRHGDASSANPMSSNQSECENGLTTVNREGRWYKTLYNRFVRWADKGVWVDVFHALASAGGPPAEVLIDSSAVRAHHCASGGKGGRKIRP